MDLTTSDDLQAILTQGAAAWNTWREAHPHVEVDLSRAELGGVDLRGANLQEVTLRQANLRGANLSGANLHHADLIEANLSEADLSKANLNEATLSWADLSGASLREATLHGAHLLKTDLRKAICNWTDLRQATLQEADLRDAALMRASLNGANLSEANLQGANLSEADLSGATLMWADLSGANLAEANLHGAHLKDLLYARDTMQGHFHGIRGLDSCSGNPIFKRDAQDQEYLDALASQCTIGWRKLVFRAWGWIDYGRSMGRVAAIAFGLVGLFGIIFALFPQILNMPADRTPFTPFYFSLITYTTLGFGDVHPVGHLAGEILVSIEVVLGYITLGLLLAILANTVARRS